MALEEDEYAVLLQSIILTINLQTSQPFVMHMNDRWGFGNLIKPDTLEYRGHLLLKEQDK